MPRGPRGERRPADVIGNAIQTETLPPPLPPWGHLRRIDAPQAVRGMSAMPPIASELIRLGELTRSPTAGILAACKFRTATRGVA